MDEYFDFNEHKKLYEYFVMFKNNPKKEYITVIFNILKNNKLNINTEIVHGYSVFHLRQTKDTIKYLLELKGDINLRNETGITPIFTQKEYDVVKFMTEKGADPMIFDDYGFSPLFWQKTPQTMYYLLNKYDLNLNNHNIRFNPKKDINDIYTEMFINGGYDPYSEYNISVTALFLQRNFETQKIMINYIQKENIVYQVDLFLETPLFKPNININLLELYINNGFNINHVNSFNNTMLFVQFNLEIVKYLLYKDIDLTIRNVNNDTAYIHHLKRNNIYICSTIKSFYSSRLIQRNWKIFSFKKNYIPIKNFKKKKELLEYLKILPPSICGTFKGGIMYQKSLDNFIQHQYFMG